MNPIGRPTSLGFGTGLTRLGKRLLIVYGAIYVLELVLEHWVGLPVAGRLSLFPLGARGFHLWQILTHPFIHHPAEPLGFLINGLVLYFFAAPVEQALGRRRFLILFYLSAAGGALCGLAFSGVSGFGLPFMGMMPSLLTLVVVFGLLSPEATILLMFVLPVKAKYLSYGTVLVTFLTFLAKVNPHGAYHLGGMLAGYLYFRGPRTILDPNRVYLKYLEWKLRKHEKRFRVIDGGRKGDDDRPTYH